jgi:hypothetical protein
MNTLLVSFYSDVDGRTYYSDHARRLSQNLKDFDIPHDIRHMPSKGSYRSNCLAKPRFILDKMNEYRRPIVWLDVDSLVHKKLSVFDEFHDKVDIGMAFPKIPTQEDPTVGFPKASPIYVNYTPKTLEFMYKWVEAAENVEQRASILFDHEVLLKLFTELLQGNSGTRMAFLGHQYCIWPGQTLQVADPHITMGLADGASKESVLKTMGFDDEAVKMQSPGNKFLVNR